MADGVQNNLRSLETVPGISLTTPVRLTDLPSSQKGIIQNTIQISGPTITKTPLAGNNDQIKKLVSKSIENLSVMPTKIAAATAGISSLPTVADSVLQIEETKKTLHKEIKLAEKQGDTKKANYLIQMSKLVGEISTLINQMNNRDSRRIEEKKKKYHVGSDLIQNSLHSKAIASLVSGIVGLGISLTLGSETGRLLDSFTGVAHSLFDKDNVKGQQENSLIQMEIQKLNEASSSNNGLRDQGLQILNEVKQWLEKAIARG